MQQHICAAGALPQKKILIGAPESRLLQSTPDTFPAFEVGSGTETKLVAKIKTTIIYSGASGGVYAKFCTVRLAAVGPESSRA